MRQDTGTWSDKGFDSLLIGAVGHRLGLLLAGRYPVVVLVLEHALLVLGQLLGAV